MDPETGALKWVLMPLRRYFDFKGRSRRKEFWSFFAAVLVVGFALIYLEVVLDVDVTFGHWVIKGEEGEHPPLLLSILFCLFIAIPMLAVQVRRFHDRDMSGWWVLVAFLPTAGTLVLLFHMSRPGQGIENRFGTNPKWDGFTIPS